MNAKHVAAALIVSLLVSAPSVLGADREWVVTGHTIFTNMGGMDPCLAAIAGIVRMQLLWFNDQVLFERSATDGGRYVYATQAGAPDPRATDVVLIETGTVYAFADPNGKNWTVTEYRVPPKVDQNDGDPDITPAPLKIAEGAVFYTWVVEIGNTTVDATLAASYNFVNVVDTCKFVDPECACQPATQTVTHNGTAGGANNGQPADGGVWDGNSHDASAPGEEHTFPHDHNSMEVDLYIGRRPVSITPPPQNL